MRNENSEDFNQDEDILNVNFNKTSMTKNKKNNLNNFAENVFLMNDSSIQNSNQKSLKSSYKKEERILKKRGIHNTIYEGFSQKEKRGKENWAFLNNCIKDLNTKSLKADNSIDLRIYSVVFNMQGKIPNKSDLDKLLPKKNYNMYIIGGVECMRSILLSVFYDNKDEWIEMIK